VHARRTHELAHAERLRGLLTGRRFSRPRRRHARRPRPREHCRRRLGGLGTLRKEWREGVGPDAVLGGATVEVAQRVDHAPLRRAAHAVRRERGLHEAQPAAVHALQGKDLCDLASNQEGHKHNTRNTPAGRRQGR